MQVSFLRWIRSLGLSISFSFLESIIVHCVEETFYDMENSEAAFKGLDLRY